MHSICGINIIESPLITPMPRMTLSKEVPVTQEFRESIDKWMLEFFGTKEYAYFFNHPFHGKRQIATSSSLMHQIRLETENERSKYSPSSFSPLLRTF